MLSVLLAGFVLLLLLGTPIAMAMFAGAILFTLGTPGADLIAIPHRMFNGIDSFVLVSIPLFLLVGQLMGSSSILQRMLELSRYLVGWMTGGLAQVNILASMLFAGISGTATADTASIGSVLIPSMVRENYDPSFSAAVTAASSTLGPVIPPSVIMVALGALVGVSVGGLFLAGVVPGVLGGVLMLVVSYLISKRRGHGKMAVDASLRSFLRVLLRASGPLSIPAVIIGGIVGGIFTPTEASNIAVVLVLFLGFGVYRDLSFHGLWEGIRGTIYLLGPVMFIISAASVFGNILIQEQVGQALTVTISALSSNPQVVLLLISIAVLILGCFIEALAIMFLVAPLLMPLITSVGINPIHFGIVLVQALMIGLITPPVGISMFISCTIAGVEIEQFTRSIWPFFVVLVITLLVSVFFPQLVLYLPGILMARSLG
jgi:C4-dicarboxylate transporter DctM subunit